MLPKLSSKKEILGFGFVPSESEHHFMVNIGAKEVTIAERFHYAENESLADMSYKIAKQNSDIKVILSKTKWDLIEAHLRVEMNRRLKLMGLPLSKGWSKGYNPVSRLFGKEIILLAWAIEDADPAYIPAGIQNWLGLKPEERWWLFTMTNAATGHAIYDKGKGWRLAIRYALTENPVMGVKPLTRFDTPLFKFDEDEEKYRHSTD